MTMGRWTAGVLVAASVVIAAQNVRAQRIERRKDRQQRRIDAGVASGKLSPAEAERLEQHQKAVDREEQAMRDANGRRLGPGQRAILNRQQNRESRRIFRQKHDGNDR